MKNIHKKTYIALTIFFLLLVSIGVAGLTLKHSKDKRKVTNSDADSPLRPYIFFTVYRQEKTIELWMASTEVDSMWQIPMYYEPAKYSFDLLPSEERFLLGYSDKTGEYEYDVEKMASQYWWDSLNVSPQGNRLLWAEYADFRYPYLNYSIGGMSRILIWDIDQKEKTIILELPNHISPFLTQEISNIAWSPNNLFVSFVISSKLGGSNHLKLLDVDTMNTIHLGRNVLGYLWSPLGTHIAYKTTREIIVIDTLGNRKFATGEQLSKISSFTWSPDGKKILLTGIGEEGESAIYLINLKKMKTEKLFELPDTKYHYSDVTWSPDGRYATFIKSIEGKDNGQLFITDTKKFDAPKLVEDISVFGTEPGQWGKAEWSQDGEVLAINGRIDNNVGIHFINPAEGRILNSFYPDNFVNQWMFTENNNTIIALIQSEDVSCPKEEIDKIVYYNWQKDSVTRFKFHGILETDLKSCELSISNFVYGAKSALDFGY